MENTNTTDARLNALERSVACIEATLPHLATKADLARVEAKMDTAMLKMESNLIKWFAGTGIAIITAIVASAAIVITMLK